MDEEPYPGPDHMPTIQEIVAGLKAMPSHFSVYTSAYYAGLVKAAEGVAKIMKETNWNAFANFNPAYTDSPKPIVKKHNHGPRPAQTFDRRGRRRY